MSSEITKRRWGGGKGGKGGGGGGGGGGLECKETRTNRDQKRENKELVISSKGRIKLKVMIYFINAYISD